MAARDPERGGSSGPGRVQWTCGFGACRAARAVRVLAESIRWFGGAGQNERPWEIPLELFLERVDGLAQDCDRVLVLGTSFGAEAALSVGALFSKVDAVVGFAPTDVVWAGVRPDGSVTSHWTLDGSPLPFVPFDDHWEADSEIPAYVGLYEASRGRFSDRLVEAAIPVEKIGRLVLVGGADDKVWPALEMARVIEARRRAHGLDTVVVSDPGAGHSAILPGEPVVSRVVKLQHGGDEESDRRLGAAAWVEIRRLLGDNDLRGRFRRA